VSAGSIHGVVEGITDGRHSGDWICYLSGTHWQCIRTENVPVSVDTKALALNQKRGDKGMTVFIELFPNSLILGSCMGSELYFKILACTSLK
jgi:hypothetical protein